MKKRFMLLLAALALVLALAGCGGNVDNVEIVEWEPSEIYSDADIEAAFRTVENYFRREFKGCTLTQLYYVGDDHADEFARIADQYDSDVEAIVIGSSFDVDSSGGNGSLNPNSTYTRWEWILVRSSGGSWRHVDHGYGYIYLTRSRLFSEMRSVSARASGLRRSCSVNFAE